MQYLLIFAAILSLPVIYWLLGFLPGRPIKLKNNRWQAWGASDQIWGFFDGDKKTFLPKSMPPGFSAQYRELIYTKYVDEAGKGNLKEHTEKSADGQTITYHEAQIIHGLKPTRLVTERVKRLRKKEIHPFDLTVDMPRSGMKFYPRLHTVTLIETAKDAMKTLGLDQPLEFVGNELQDAVGPWGPEQEEKWAIESGFKLDDPEQLKKFKSHVVTKMIALKIDDHKSIIIDGKPLMQYMNDRIRVYGLKIIEFSLNVGYDDTVKAILDARGKQSKQDEETVLKGKMKETNDQVRLDEKAQADQDRDLDNKYFEEVTEKQLTATGAMLEKVNGAYKEGVTLFMNAGSGTDVITALLNKVAQNTSRPKPAKEKGGADATK